MPSRCPPGVICIENVSITIVFIIAMSVLLFINLRSTQRESPADSRSYTILKEHSGGFLTRPSSGFTDIPGDVLMNPYEAPLKDYDYDVRNQGGSAPDFIRNRVHSVRGMRINIPTQSIDTPYRQIGILTRKNGSGANTILPLMGKQLFTNRDKWNFYTINDSNNMVKLPITHKGKSCTNEYGCDNLYNGDNVYVEGHGDAFAATIYDNQVMRYIPFL